MPDDEKPMTDEERRAFLEQWQQDNLASMNPFERYLYDNGLFGDVVRREITAEAFASMSAARNVSDIGRADSMGGLPIAPTNATRTPR
jgi:hypothetical protein